MGAAWNGPCVRAGVAHPRPAPLDAAQPTLLDGRYELRRRIASGGMGEVYLAHDRRLEREVAVKLLVRDETSGAEATERFRREARVLASLNHPHIVAVFDWSSAGEQPFLVMEYVPGPSLKAVLREEGAFAVERALEVAAQVVREPKVIPDVGL